MTITRKSIASYALALTALFVMFLPAVGNADNATYNNNVGVVVFDMASGDTLPAFKSNSSNNRTAKHVYIVTATGSGKYYRLREGTDGTGHEILYHFGSKDMHGDTLTAGTTQTIHLDVDWTLPNTGMYLETDDSVTSGYGVYIETVFGN